jgi:hypothetical protein
VPFEGHVRVGATSNMSGRVAQFAVVGHAATHVDGDVGCAARLPLPHGPPGRKGAVPWETVAYSI